MGTDKNKTALAIVKPGQFKSIDVRRQMTTIPEVAEALNPVDKLLFVASVKTPISEIPEPELIDKLQRLINVISRDIGIKQIEKYDITRFYDILKRYYYNLTLHEIKLAFELSLTGELDAYLPKDKDGNPDKNHYQSFNVEYITKILNAYKKRSKETESKAYMALPKPKQEVSPDKIAFYENETRKMILSKFSEYKETGVLNLNDVNEYVIYQRLNNAGLAVTIQVTPEDEKAAVNSLIKKAQTGIINSFVGDCVRHLQTKHPGVAGKALIIARERAIKQSFDKIINSNINIKDIFKYE